MEDYYRLVVNGLSLPKIGPIDIFEIILLVYICYYLAKAVRGTRAWLIIKGIVIIAIVYMVAYLIGLKVTVILFQSILIFMLVALVVIMQPELRRLVEKLGSSKLNGSIIELVRSIKGNSNTGYKMRYSDNTIQEILKAVEVMSKNKVGALVVIEFDVPLNEYIDTGIGVDAKISSELLINIFEPNTPLHDGALIIRDNKIISCTAYLPLADDKCIGKDLGTRHRAAIGVSGVTDCIVITVSEETGRVSFTKKGKIDKGLTVQELGEKLNDNQKVESIELGTNRGRSVSSLFKSNLYLKLVTTLAVLIMWVSMINTTDPIISKTFNNVPIKVINEAILTELKYAHKIIGSDTVNVKITDRKSKIDTIDISDISVVADLRTLSITNSVYLNALVNKNSTAQIELSKKSINVDIEDIITTEMRIDTILEGDENSKYFISNIGLDTNRVTISGAKSVVSKIGKAIVVVDQSKLTEDTQINKQIIVVDKNGEEIDKSNLSLSVQDVTVDIQLYDIKNIGLGIELVFNNVKLEELIESIEYSMEDIYIAGRKELLEQINVLSITVPIDVKVGEVSKSTFIKSVDLNEYTEWEETIIPDDYSNLNIQLNFKPFELLVECIDVSDIEIKNSKDRYRYTLLEDTIEAMILIEEKESQITNGDIEVYVDVDGLGSGVKEVPVKIKNESKVFIYNDIYISVQIE